MRKRQSDVPVLIVRPQIEKLFKASDTNQTNLCPFPGANVSEDQVFSAKT